jgi:PAS domain S-box-containing protein
MTILVVEDEAESRALLTTILTAEGYEVRPADRGELALASVAVSRPALILLDIRMPGMDGLEVCRRLKENPETRDIPVIFLSASVGLPEMVEGFKLGAVDFVSKPFQREELLARVHTHLELSALRANLEEQVQKRTAELRESEARFRNMADAAPVMIWASDTSKRCVFFNRGWLDFTGRSLEQELDAGWTEGVHPEDAEFCLAIYHSSFDQRRSYETEYRLRRADGEYRWILERGVPRISPDGVFAGFIGSGIDITDLKQNHETMLAAQKLESLGVMAAGVAHDFGNLLGGILGETDLALMEMPRGSAGRESVERIAAMAEFATEIVRLLMASAATGVESSAMEAVDLSFLVEQTLRLQTISLSKRASVRTSLATGLPAVWGNVAQLRQVVMNLLTNASDALEGKDGTINVATGLAHLGPWPTAGDSSFSTLRDGDYVRLTVSDTGCGMSPETRAKIFDQFFTTKTQGRGLGLAAVHGIVRSHGGAINVVSSRGAGAMFEILLPCARQSASSAAGSTAR